MKTYTIRRETTDFYEVEAKNDDEALRLSCPTTIHARVCLSIVESEKNQESKDSIFINHIKSHLKETEFVICKICGKSVDEIIREN